jgi:RHS repeat-associated protein
MPFGEELNAGVGNRSAALKYALAGQDNLRKRFTGYEKDIETGLDFAEARYYNNSHGRFTAVDPLLLSGKLANPQTFNRYPYVLNNPLIFTDKTGLQAATQLNEDSNEIVAKISSLPLWISDILKGLSGYYTRLVNGNTSGDKLAQATDYAWQRYSNGEPSEKILGGGINSAAVNSILKQTNESYDAAKTIGETNIQIQLLLLGMNNGGKSSTVIRANSLEGQTGIQVVDPANTGRTITDIDRVASGILWEQKSATSAINPITKADTTAAWIEKNITQKFAKILDARQHLKGYEDAPVGFQFTRKGVDPAFKSAVESEITRLRGIYTDIKIYVQW